MNADMRLILAFLVMVLVSCGITFSIQASTDNFVSTSFITHTQTVTTVITQSTKWTTTITIPKITSFITTIEVANMTTYASTITYTNYTVTKVTYTNYTLATITTLVTYVNKTVITVAGGNQTETNATFTNTKLIVGVGDYIASKGDQILIDVFINDSGIIAGGRIELHFNSSIVTVDSVLGGDFGQPIANINNIGGVIGIAVASPVPVEKSLGVLAKIRFTCHRQGYTRLMITSAELNDMHGRIIIPKVRDGSITITSFLKGDLNGNGRLDTGDVTLILRMIVGLEPVNLLGDMNGNGRIDTGDATLLLRKIVGLE